MIDLRASRRSRWSWVERRCSSRAASRRPAPGQAPGALNADGRAASVDFLKRVEEYVALHKKLEATLPPLGRSKPIRSRSTNTSALAR